MKIEELKKQTQDQMRMQEEKHKAELLAEKKANEEKVAAKERELEKMKQDQLLGHSFMPLCF